MAGRTENQIRYRVERLRLWSRGRTTNTNTGTNKRTSSQRSPKAIGMSSTRRQTPDGSHADNTTWSDTSSLSSETGPQYDLDYIPSSSLESPHIRDVDAFDAMAMLNAMMEPTEVDLFLQHKDNNGPNDDSLLFDDLINLSGDGGDDLWDLLSPRDFEDL